MILGFSDATLCITKRGQGVREQGALCVALGPHVAPRIYDLLVDGYEMEILEQCPVHDETILSIVYDRLYKSVWSREDIVPVWNGGWLAPLHAWARSTAPWLIYSINEQYPVEPVYGYNPIHGDPTIANVMMRGDHHVITDPMPRMRYRAEIPNRIEVDLGKLVQSAAGWENHLGCPHALVREEDLILNMLDDTLRRRALLWAGIHLARIAARATKKQNESTAQWAEWLSKELVYRIGGM